MVELSLALAIIAFALIPLLGLLPTGLSMQRKAIEETTLAQITQAVVGDLQRAEFDTLVQSASSGNTISAIPIKYFDDQGRYLGDDDKDKLTTAEESFRIYDVKTDLVLTGSLPTTGANARAIASYNLVQAKILVAMNPAKKSPTVLFSATNSVNYDVRFALVAKMK